MIYAPDLPNLETGSLAPLVNDKHNPELPEWLGIATIELGGRARCILTDVQHFEVLDLLDNHQKITLAKWLWERRSSSPKVVTMNMWRPFRAVVQDLFPGIPITIDRFDIMRIAHKAVDEVRVKLSTALNKKERMEWFKKRKLLRESNHYLTEHERAQLDTWLCNNPDLATAYLLKEELSRIYDLVNRYKAEKALDDWRRSIPKPMQKPFRELLSAIKDWRTEVLAYFDHREAAYGLTECLDSVARRVDDFEFLRERILSGRQLEPGTVD